MRRSVYSREATSLFGEITAVAGGDQSVEDIASITTLDGTGSTTTVGGGITAYQWEIISGNGLIIDSPTSSTTDISGTAVVGDTVIQLTVWDGNGNKATDQLTISIVLGDPLTISSTTPDVNQDGTFSFINGQPSEVIDLSYTLLNGDNPDSMTAGTAMSGTLSYLSPSAVGQVTLDGNGEATVNYNGNGANFQVEIEITGRSSSYPLPVSTGTAYIPFYS